MYVAFIVLVDILWFSDGDNGRISFCVVVVVVVVLAKEGEEEEEEEEEEEGFDVLIFEDICSTVSSASCTDIIGNGDDVMILIWFVILKALKIMVSLIGILFRNLKNI